MTVLVDPVVEVELVVELLPDDVVLPELEELDVELDDDEVELEGVDSEFMMSSS